MKTNLKRGKPRYTKSVDGKYRKNVWVRFRLTEEEWKHYQEVAKSQGYAGFRDFVEFEFPVFIDMGYYGEG